MFIITIIIIIIIIINNNNNNNNVHHLFSVHLTLFLKSLAMFFKVKKKVSGQLCHPDIFVFMEISKYHYTTISEMSINVTHESWGSICKALLT